MVFFLVVSYSDNWRIFLKPLEVLHVLGGLAIYLRTPTACMFSTIIVRSIQEPYNSQFICINQIGIDRGGFFCFISAIWCRT